MVGQECVSALGGGSNPVGHPLLCF
jgi:hypothetical protein